MASFAFAPTPHAEASAFIKAKPAVVKKVFDDMLPELKARAFVISGLEELETASKVRDLIATVPEGADWDKTKKTITEHLADLGDKAESRAELLLRTHVFQAYSAAAYRVATDPVELDVFPYWKYQTMGDDKVRDSHAALDGLILPANDPFWKDHYPPWDWGCRCQVIPITRDEVEGIKQKEADLPPEQRTVYDEGPLIDRLRHGELTRALPKEDARGDDVGLKQLGRSQTWDVQSDYQRGREGAVKWNPGDLRIPMDQLKDQYKDAPDLWAAFEQSMKAHRIAELPGNPTAWDWLTQPQPSP